MRFKADEISHEGGSLYVAKGCDGALWLRLTKGSKTLEVQLCGQQARDLMAVIDEALKPETERP